MTASEFVSLLEARGLHPHRNGDGWSARCPAHEDSNPSLSVSEGADGRTLLRCHAGCDVKAICEALSVTLADLFPPREQTRPGGNGAPRGRIVVCYPYTNENGTLLFEVCRFAPKDFRQRRPDPTAPGGWTWNIKGVRRVLFRLPEVLAAVREARPVFAVEGEKDALALVRAGFCATCNPGGAGKWRNEFSDALRGADVVVLPDADEPGRRHAAQVATSLRGVAKSVRVVELPAELNGRPVKDVSDWFAAGGQAADLDELAQAAPLWAPTTKAPEAARPEVVGTADAQAAAVRGAILGILTSDASPVVKRTNAARAVVTALCDGGRFYFHAERRDFDSALFFNRTTKRLERVRSDAFLGWLSAWLGVNRADGLFRYVQSEVETAALAGPHTTPIMPETFWASRPGVVYLSNGDGALVRVDARGCTPADNGADGILFAAGRTLAPWRLIEPRDALATCKVFADARCTAAHGQNLLRLWMYSLPTTPRSKPPLCLAGDVGSGKTRLAKGIAEFYGLPFVAAKVEEAAEGDFWPTLDGGGLFTLDNADTRCRWLADALAAAATDGCAQRRKLYTNAETVTLRARAWVAVTTANPTFANDAGLADRLLVVRMARRDAETSDAQLSDEVAEHRDAGLAHICQTLAQALADTAPTPPGLNRRHPDFAAFAVRIGRALNGEAESVAALRAAEADKSSFCLENDSVGSALAAFVNGAGEWTGTAAELLPKLAEVDAELGERLTPKRLGKRLAALWPHLEAQLDAHKEMTRGGVNCFRFSCPSAGFAGFGEAISEKSLREREATTFGK